MVGIYDPACELLPPWTKELYVLMYGCPSTFSLTSPPLPKLNVQYIQTVCGCGGVELCCRPYSAGVLHCFFTYSEPTKLLHHPKQMTSKGDI
jgi:hypothetical protein